jgi:alanyl-tRNA synthetase
MTKRLYYADSHLRSFEATVRRCDAVGDQIQVVLDQTAFYPTSGGQPFDTGRLGSAAVTEVVDREDGEIAHVVSGPFEPGQQVRGEIDWPRRFDHMQQHTGQHVLSAVFVRLCEVETVSFHLGSEVSTIDLAREVTPAEIDRAELEANRVVWDDRPVRVRMATEEDAGRLPLRKQPDRTGEIRIVEILDLDLSACGGTHVSRTGAIGAVSVASWERVRQGTRISFVCGERALGSHRRFRDVVAALCRALSVTPSEVVPHVERVLKAGHDAARASKEYRAELAGYRAASWREAAEPTGPIRLVVRHEPDADSFMLRQLAQAVVAEPGMVAALVGGGDPLPVVVARSPDVSIDAGAIVRSATAALGGRGGGRPELAQGGIAAEPSAVVTFLRQALGP